MAAPPSSAFELAKARVGHPRISATLAFAGGFLDGFTYVGHGHVFANAMTANVVLLGINSVSGAWTAGFPHLFPIIAFLFGIWISELIQLHSKRLGLRAPYNTVLLLEMAVLLVLLLLPPETENIIITTSIAFAASVQVETFREVNGQAYSSTFTTGNLRTLSEAAFRWWFRGHDPKAARTVRDFSFICTSFLLGAISGGYSVKRIGKYALCCELALLVCVALQVRSRLRSPLFRIDA